MGYSFNPITGELDLTRTSGYSGPLYDLTGQTIATVLNGLIVSVVFTPTYTTDQGRYYNYVSMDGLSPVILS